MCPAFQEVSTLSCIVSPGTAKGPKQMLWCWFLTLPGWSWASHLTSLCCFHHLSGKAAENTRVLGEG